MNPDNQNDIRTKDIMVMSFLKIKYWGLFRDVEANRDLYTQIRLEDLRAFLLFDNGDEQEYRKKHFKELFKGLGYGPSDIQLLKPILSETFPGWCGKRHINEDNLLSTNRIGHRDLLDLYFSYGISHQTFKERMEHVTPIVERVKKGKYIENSLMKQFSDFNRYALSQEQGGDVARLLTRRLLSLQQQQAVPVIVWRCWLRTVLKHKYGSNEEATNALLASVLSGANDSLQRTLPLNTSSTSDMATVIDQRVDGAITLFEDITTYLSAPYTGLLLLLFVFPPRGNSFFLDYINRHGLRDLYLPILNYIDDYFIAKKHNVFREYSDWQQWRFVLYQWSMSISQDNRLNTGIEDAPVRHRAVNNYVFSLLSNHPNRTYQFIHGQFWKENDEGIELYKHITSEIEQYNNEEDRKHIVAIVREALSSKELTASQKKKLVEFDKLFKQFVANSPL